MSISTKSTATTKSGKKSKKPIDKSPKDDFMDRFHPPDKKICEIIPTTNKEKIDPFFPFRPQTSKEYLNYNISQTEAKMDCGPTKIHYSYIRAEYEKYPEDFVFPVEPPKKRKARPQHGRGPVWLYLDEVYKRKLDREQDLIRIELAARLGRKKMLTKHEKTRMVSKIIENALPDWFHELAPSQLQSVERLSNAIQRDLKYNTICNVQEIIAGLGLVLRPNHIYVERALKRCCECPVEFLTLLYSYRRTNRANSNVYDLNDKLILSSIVHLSLPIILREMHVRVPSPPPEEVPPVKVTPCKKKCLKYDSPYLEPFTFQPEPPKHTGVYKNRHIQYPESPYFSYLADYYWDMYINQFGSNEEIPQRKQSRRLRSKHTNLGFSDHLSAIDFELNHERDCAQQEYDDLFEGMTTPRLLRASLFRRCPLKTPSEHVEVEINKFEYNEPENVEEEKPSEKFDVDEEFFEDEECEGILEEAEIPEEDEIIDIKDKCKKKKEKIKKKYRLPLSREENLKNKVKDGECTSDDNDLQSEDNNLQSETNNLLSEANNLQSEDNNLQSEANNLQSEDNNLHPEENFPMYTNIIPICGGIIYHPKYKWVPIISGIISPDLTCHCNIKPKINPKESIQLFKSIKKKQTGECTCIDRFLKQQQKEKKIQAFKREVKKLCNCEICSCKYKLPKTPSPIPSIASFIPPSNDIYTNSQIENQLIEIEEPPPFQCKCKDIVQEHLSHVENKNDKPPKRSFVISDLTDDGKKIIGAVRAPKACRCLEKYQKRIEKFEREKCIELTQRALKSAKKVFCFGGVKLDPDGKPIYMIAGVSGEKPCGKCVEREMEEVREEQRKAEMPILPSGRIQYHISGVRKTPQGNVYIISGASPIEPCNCMKLYDTFMLMHSRCIHLYRRYLEKIENDTREYLAELGPEEPTSSSSSNSDSSTKPQSSKSTSESTNLSTSSTTKTSETTSGSSSSSEGCICGPFPRSEESQPEEVIEEEIEEEVEEESLPEEEEKSCNRYVILKKIPRKRCNQIKVLKKVLYGMALDGYPFVDLPGVYKLPHFRLWMALRTNSCITMEDRQGMLLYSKRFWTELTKCRPPVQVDGLKIKDSEAQKYTFAQARFIKKWTDDVKEREYRKVKQSLIKNGRMFFPSMFSYELPTSTFRDCYFAYIPFKEESVFPRFPWAQFEYRNYSMIREKKAKQRNG